MLSNNDRFLINEDIKTLEDLFYKVGNKLIMVNKRRDQLMGTRISLNNKIVEFRNKLKEDYHE